MRNFVILVLTKWALWVIKSRRIRWTEHRACMGKRRGPYVGWVPKPGKMKPFGRQRHRLKDNIKMDLQVVGWG
jgi:hypothetical protein